MSNRWNRRASSNCGTQLALLVLLLVTGCSAKSKDAIHSASPRLRIVAVIYGRYMGNFGGKMPAGADGFAQYINLNERQLLKQYGFESGEQLLANSDDQPRLIVLYGADRKRTGTKFVAIEEVSGGAQRYGVDPLGIVEEISPEQAGSLLVSH